ncbi:MAG: hypothetical protein H0U52_02655 [Chloroflexi bacterium]|nr:hypothetical protein [Chloroflexota bacterium]
MPDDLETVLQLVAEGRLTAAQAAPILDALAFADGNDPALGPEPSPSPAGPDASRGAATAIRIEVTANGRKTINLRVPVSLGRFALDRVPGLSGTNADLVRQALAEGRSGTLLDIDEDGSGVRIALE